MSDVVDAIEDSFKQLVKQKVYRSITVKELCEGAFISRRTFYANFTDKRAVVAYLFRRDAVAPMKRILELLSAEEALGMASAVLARFYQGVYDEREYYFDLVKPMCGLDPTFELVVARALCKVITDFVGKANPRIDQQQLYWGAYYHASAQAIFLEKWLYDSCEPLPSELADYQTPLIVPSLAQLADLRLPDV